MLTPKSRSHVARFTFDSSGLICSPHNTLHQGAHSPWFTQTQRVERGIGYIGVERNTIKL